MRGAVAVETTGVLVAVGLVGGVGVASGLPTWIGVTTIASVRAKISGFAKWAKVLKLFSSGKIHVYRTHTLHHQT